MNFLKQLFDRKMGITFLLGFACGLPYLLTGDVLKAMLSDSHIDIKTIGFFTWVGGSYTLKFLWSPIMDNVSPPFMGIRKGWMLITQILLLCTIFFLGTIDPTQNLTTLALLAVTVAFVSASQDIVVDAFRREIMVGEDESRLGLATSYYVSGYRVGMLISNIGGLYLAQYLSWSAAYQIMAGFMVIGILATVFAPEVQAQKRVHSLKDAIIGPFLEFFKRKGALEILAFILLYKLGDSMASSITMPLYLNLGFEKSDIANIVKGAGILATLIGAYLGGVTMIKLGTKKALISFGILQILSTFVFSYLAMSGKSFPVLWGTIIFENVTSGMGTAAYAGFMMSLVSLEFSATQFALLTSLMAIPMKILGGFSGVMVDGMGWFNYFIFCGLIGVPGLLLILRFNKWEKAN
ncbi:MAG: AmpG family muropeptide MFS transporter [Bacteriovoracaceae bacterium]